LELSSVSYYTSVAVAGNVAAAAAAATAAMHYHPLVKDALGDVRLIDFVFI